MATTTLSGWENLHKPNLKMYEEPKMNHWNTHPDFFLVSDSHEKLPNNLSKMSKPFQMSEIQRFSSFLPQVYSGFPKRLSSKFSKLKALLQLKIVIS